MNDFSMALSFENVVLRTLTSSDTTLLGYILHREWAWTKSTPNLRHFTFLYRLFQFYG